MRRVIELGEVVGGTVEKGKASSVAIDKEARGAAKSEDRSKIDSLLTRNDMTDLRRRLTLC
jgi:hypothetical protein